MHGAEDRTTPPINRVGSGGRRAHRIDGSTAPRGSASRSPLRLHHWMIEVDDLVARPKRSLARCRRCRPHKAPSSPSTAGNHGPHAGSIWKSVPTGTRTITRLLAAGQGLGSSSGDEFTRVRICALLWPVSTGAESYPTTCRSSHLNKPRLPNFATFRSCLKDFNGARAQTSHGNAAALSTFSTCRAHADLVPYDRPSPSARCLWRP